jgi:hypothetical protein
MEAITTTTTTTESPALIPAEEEDEDEENGEEEEGGEEESEDGEEEEPEEPEDNKQNKIDPITTTTTTPTPAVIVETKEEEKIPELEETCPEGFQLADRLAEAEDGSACLDVDECATEDQFGCSHLCVNTQGSAHCDCPSGWKMTNDGKTCRGNQFFKSSSQGFSLIFKKWADSISQILTNVRRATISVVRISASIRMGRPTVHAPPATPWTPVTTKRASMLTNVPTKCCPTLDALITVSTCPEAPNASARPATSFVPIRKLAKVKNQNQNRFNQIRAGTKKVLGVVGKKRYRRMRQGKWRLFTRVRQSQRRNEVRMSRWIPSE